MSALVMFFVSNNNIINIAEIYVGGKMLGLSFKTHKAGSSYLVMREAH
jgi:hypothetical protein